MNGVENGLRDLGLSDPFRTSNALACFGELARIGELVRWFVGSREFAGCRELFGPGRIASSLLGWVEAGTGLRGFWMNVTAPQQTAAEGLIDVYDGRQLLLFGFDQAHSRLKEVTLGEQHVHVIVSLALFRPEEGSIIKFSGDID